MGRSFWNSKAQEFLSAFAGDAGEDVAEYAVMLSVVLVVVMGMVHLIGANAQSIFSQVGSSIQ